MEKLRVFAVSSTAVTTVFLLAVTAFCQNPGQSTKVDAQYYSPWALRSSQARY
jgi:hypothetical protein